MTHSEGEHIKKFLEAREKNIEIDSRNPVVQGGFTQVPNFILESDDIGIGAKLVYAMFLRYAWHNDFCFPGQDRLAKDLGICRSRVTQLVSELETADLIEIERRGQGKTNLYRINFRVQNRKPSK